MILQTILMSFASDNTYIVISLCTLCYFPAVLKSPEIMLMKMFLVIKLIPNITVMSSEKGKPLFEMCCFHMGIAR